jgi:hypothetical protein
MSTPVCPNRVLRASRLLVCLAALPIGLLVGLHDAKAAPSPTAAPVARVTVLRGGGSDTIATIL